MGLRSRTEVETGPGTRQALLAVCGGLHFALPAEIVRGIAGEPGQRTEDVLASLGVTSPVMEFGDLFAVESCPGSDDGRVVVCGAPGASRAFHVDRLLGLQDLDMQQFRPLPPHFTGQERQWFGGLFLYEDGIALLVNPGWLLGCEPDSGPVVSGAAALRVLEPEQVAHARPVPAGRPPVIVTVEDDVFGVMQLEEATDAEDLPWAQL